MEITLGSIVSYAVGVPLVLVSVLLTILSPVGLLPMLLGLLILPPVRRQLSKRANIDFSRGASAGIGAIGVIAAIAVLIMAALSGGAGGLPGSDVSNVSVTAEDATPQEPVTELTIEWNSRAQSSVDPDPDSLTNYNSNEGEKFVILRMTVTNDDGEPIDLTPRMFSLRSEGVEYDHQALFGSGNSLSGVTLNQGGSHSAWVAFTLPEDVSEAELVVDQDPFLNGEVGISFEQNPEKPVNMSD